VYKAYLDARALCGLLVGSLDGCMGITVNWGRVVGWPTGPLTATSSSLNRSFLVQGSVDDQLLTISLALMPRTR